MSQKSKLASEMSHISSSNSSIVTRVDKTLRDKLKQTHNITHKCHNYNIPSEMAAVKTE